MLPWQMNSILVIVVLRIFLFYALSIARIGVAVERKLLVGTRCDLRLQLDFCPAELSHSANIPASFCFRFTGFHDDHISRPANHQGIGYQIRAILIGAVEVPHPAHIAKRKAGSLHVSFAKRMYQIRHERFFSLKADVAANFPIERHKLRPVRLGAAAIAVDDGGNNRFGIASVFLFECFHGVSFPA
jgi:hypothetical protein